MDIIDPAVKEQEQCKNKINNETNTFTNSITLSYLTNPSYQPGLAKKNARNITKQ